MIFLYFLKIFVAKCNRSDILFDPNIESNLFNLEKCPEFVDEGEFCEIEIEKTFGGIYPLIDVFDGVYRKRCKNGVLANHRSLFTSSFFF
ncbi:hypothetical protein MHBO_003354 [Bonamia ostreae]|uniref:Uncharacterized protein n=1 Tax=Bonamia ostreae TaxID=126728 RepID=A0ABV2AQ77_9EUKA